MNDTKETEKLVTMMEADQLPLVSVSTVFPFDLFPNKIVVDRSKITLVRNTFFFTHQVESFMIKDLMSVIVESSLFFATIKLVDRFFTDDPTEIRYLFKSDAEKIRTVVHGLMIAASGDVNVEKVPRGVLVDNLEKLGSPSTGIGD